jgi:hypothetical protein
MGSACAARMWPKPMLADDGCVLGFDQAVVAGLPGPAFGLLDQELVEQLRDRGVDELAAVIGVEALDAKGELAQYGCEHGQASLADGWGCGHNLPLRDLADGVDVIDALGSRAAAGTVALVHRIDAQVARLPLGWGLRRSPIETAPGRVFV